MIPTPKTDAHQSACLRSGGRSSEGGRNAYWLARGLERENMQLRAIFPKILESLGSGFCSEDSSIEFLEQIPKEIQLVMKSKNKKALMTNDLAYLCEDGTWEIGCSGKCYTNQYAIKRDSFTWKFNGFAEMK